MALAESTCEILKVCKPLIQENRESIGQTFYEILFEKYPSLKSMFNMSHFKKDGEKPGRQPMVLADALVAYCTYCDDLGKLGGFVERVANKHVSFNVLPEQYDVVGGVLLEALETVLGAETFNETVKAAVAEAYFFLADIFKATEASLKTAKEEAEGGWTGWRALTLVDKKVESDQHTSFYFSSADDTPLYKYQPGQYISIKIDGIPDSEYSHVRNFSLSDDPSSEHYRITVKKEEDGAVSSYLHDTLQVGDTVEVGVPCGGGEFTLTMTEEDVITFLAAGTGITPVLSMLKTNKDHLGKSTLVYRVSNPEKHPFKQEIEDIENETGLKVHHLYSTEMQEKELEYNADLLKDMVDLSGKFYICGPPSYIQDNQNYLQELGVETENVFFQFFGPPA